MGKEGKVGKDGFKKKKKQRQRRDSHKQTLGETIEDPNTYGVRVGVFSGPTSHVCPAVPG